jgi:hypothetical protein
VFWLVNLYSLLVYLKHNRNESPKDYTTRFIKWSPFLRFPQQSLFTTLLSPVHTTCPAHHSIVDLKIRKSLSSSMCSLLQFPVNSSPLCPHIFLSTLFSNTLSLCSSFSMWQQVSHICKITGKIMVLCIVIFMFAVPFSDVKVWKATPQSRV